jgi:hypothetical protein
MVVVSVLVGGSFKMDSSPDETAEGAVVVAGVASLLLTVDGVDSSDDWYRF